MLPFTNPDAAGFLPMFFNPHDPRPAKEQAHTAYAHGGGWRPFEGFDLKQPAHFGGGYFLIYPGDPPMYERSRGRLRDELIVLFESDWVAIIQPDGSYEIARMD